MSEQYPVMLKAEQSVQFEMPVTRSPAATTVRRVVANSANSSGDKELRKKLRNRQSAQAARERKKARMLELENKVAELLEENGRMEDENQYLRASLETVVSQCTRPGIRLNLGNHDFHMVRFPIINFTAAAAGKAACAEMIAPDQPTTARRQHAAAKNAKHVVIAKPSELGDVASVHSGGTRTADRLLTTPRTSQSANCSSPSAAVSPHAIRTDKVVYLHAASRLHQTASLAVNVIGSILKSSAPARCDGDKTSVGGGAVADIARAGVLIERRSDARRQPWATCATATQHSLPSIDAVLQRSPPVAKSRKVDRSDDDKCFPRPASGETRDVWRAADSGDKIGSRDGSPVAAAATDIDELLLGCRQLSDTSYNDPSSLSPDYDGLLNFCTGSGGEEIASPLDAFSDVFCSDGGGELFSNCDRSGSNSGVSMTDSLDWIADAPVFDL